MKYILAIITAMLISGCEVNILNDSKDSSNNAQDGSQVEQNNSVSWEVMTEEEKANELVKIDAGLI